MTESAPVNVTMWTELRAWVRDVGFPIAVAVYLLVRIDPALQDLRVALVEMRVAIANLAGAIERTAR